MIPLRIAKAITIHKSQGLTIGEEKVWERVIITLPSKGMRRSAGWNLLLFLVRQTNQIFVFELRIAITFLMVISSK